MHYNSLWLLALGAAAVEAFRDTSPFFLASTSEILASSSQFRTAPSLLDDISSKLSGCPSDYYVVAFQPGVHSTDFADRKSTPRLGAKLLGEDEAIRSSIIVSEVAGALDAKQIRDIIEEKCGAQKTVIDASSGTYPSSFEKAPCVIAVNFPMLPLGSERARQLTDNDGLLADIIERIPSPQYTLLYVTSPREFGDSDSVIYQSEDSSYPDPVHAELKRDYFEHARQDESASNKSLFQEYQYLTPGIFMGLMAGFVFLLILYVGFSALTSLQVPYAAFDKDTAFGAQKKQQ